MNYNTKRGDKMKSNLVQNIKKICAQKKISIGQVESDLDFSPGLISRWTRMSPSIDKIIAVADYLGVTIDELVGRNEENKKRTLINKIYLDSCDGILQWLPCGYMNPFHYPISNFKELKGSNCVCGYCQYIDGFFILACMLNDDNEPEKIGLYAVPSTYETPVDQFIEKSEIIKLFEVIKDDITWRNNIEAADEFIERYMNQD